MRLALVGYGKMGQAIEAVGKKAGHEISIIVDMNNQEAINDISPINTDVAIEFSQPASALNNIKTLLKNKVTTMSGTTGWIDHYKEVTDLCESLNGTFLYASNFSIGVNLFFEMNEWLASKMASLSSFHPEMAEIHHTEKKDAPSGTAITLAEGIIKENTRISKWVNEPTKFNDQLGIESKREPGVPGTHVITYRSEMESIEISHTAHDREIFAQGVIKVAEWVTNKQGVQSMKDFLKHL